MAHKKVGKQNTTQQITQEQHKQINSNTATSNNRQHNNITITARNNDKNKGDIQGKNKGNQISKKRGHDYYSI